MDPKVSENPLLQPRRRSVRQASAKVLNFEPTPRGPLKRTKKITGSGDPAGKVNGTKEKGDSSEDEESPKKKSRVEPGGEERGEGDEKNMDVEASDGDTDRNKDQEMTVGREFFHLHPTHQGNLQDVRLTARCKKPPNQNEDPGWTNLKHSQKASAASIKSPVQNRFGSNRDAAPPSKTRSMADYRRTMELKARSEKLYVNSPHVPSVHQASQISNKLAPRVNNILVQKKTARPLHRKEVPQTKSVDDERSRSSSRGFKWCSLGLIVILLLGFATLLLFSFIPALPHRAGNGGGAPPSTEVAAKFADHLSFLETQFPSQRLELWRRSRIHLEKHLKTEQPSEPVSLIFAAGRSAERTLHCLARGLAHSFSSALNASVHYIDGAATAGQDSDQVKLDIDTQLQAAFEEGKRVAVIHRFEELPPGSTLIFYRYCDHENAIFKKVFLLFTVLLPQEEVSSDRSLHEVEELVQDYVKERLVGSRSQAAAFNKMDTDKYSGLWSRISHLILPVVAEKHVELRGCK